MLINIVTHKNFMPKFKANVSERFKFKLAGDVPEGNIKPHGEGDVPNVHPDEPNIKGPHPDDPNAPVKPNDKAPSKDLGDGHKATLDENNVPIVCSRCDVLRKRFKDVLANMDETERELFEQRMNKLDHITDPGELVDETQRIAADLAYKEKGIPIGSSEGPTRFVTEVEPKKFGKVQGKGTIDTKPTIDAIENGSLPPRNTYNNREGHVELLGKPNGYWKEYHLPQYGGSSSPLRILKGDGGEYFLSPDHYESIIPLH